MSLKEIKTVKKNKYFRRFDLFLYFFLLLFLVASFGIFFFVGAEEDILIDALEIRYKSQKIGEYNFEQHSFVVEEGFEAFFSTKEEQDVFLIYIYTSAPSEDEYNVLEVNPVDRTADMSESNCSFSKDCTYMHIRKVGQTIVCVPHNLVIEAISYETYDDEIIIG